MKRLNPLDWLDGDEHPLAAAFCSFTFDPEFFENHILRAALRLRFDPVEEPRRYHQEARAALQQIPVATIVDARMRPPGHRLPYDLLEVGGTIFHPKLALLLFEDHARLLIGSGNLTRGGYGDNAELWFHHDASYDGDAGVLLALRGFLERVQAHCRNEGTQLDLILEMLSARLPRGTSQSRVALLSSYEGALLDQFRALVPDDARLVGAGVLAPFFETDDVQASDLGTLDAVLNALTDDVDGPVDVGFVWDPSPLRTETPLDHLEDAVGKLCVWSLQDEDGSPSTEYLTLRSVTERQINYLDQHGRNRRWDRSDAEEAMQTGDFGPVGQIDVFAPAHLVQSLNARRRVDFWLHPSWQYVDGRPCRRPLHAKLLLLNLVVGKKRSTLALVGSPNPSRAALLRGATEGGNVELAVAFMLEGHLTLRDLCTEIVHAPLDQMTLRERTYPVGDPNLGLWIESAVHNAGERSLTIEWAKEGPAPLPTWDLKYLDRSLSRGNGPPSQPFVIANFDLSPASCEVRLCTNGHAFTVPITVRDLSALPVDASLAELSLQELLALLGRRIGKERLGTLRGEKGQAGSQIALEAIFGEGFGPTDVFRAWWALEEDLSSPRTTLGGFRLQLEGALGCRAIWTRLLESLEAADERARLSPDEAWFYGAELRRTLGRIEVPDGPDSRAKKELLNAFLKDLDASLRPHAPDVGRAPWIAAVTNHYALEGKP